MIKQQRFVEYFLLADDFFLILLMSYEYTFIDGAEKVKDYIRINGFDYKNVCC